MTLLMWNHEAAGFTILTDTLDVDAETSAPIAFHSKVYPMLERNTVIVGTGSAALVERWAQWLRRQPPIEPELLANVASVELQLLWRELCQECPPVGTRSTSTIYHFTINDGLPVVYTYRSTNSFSFERDSEPGRAVKPFLGHRPSPSYPADGTDGPVFTDQRLFEDLPGMIDLARRIRADQDIRPADERVHIGGELYLTTFVPGEILHKRVHIFEDRDEIAAGMLLDRGIDLWDDIRIDLNPGAPPLDIAAAVANLTDPN